MLEEVTYELLSQKEYNLAKADILMWLSRAPTVSQGGQSYSFSEEQRKQFRSEALAILDEFAKEEKHTKYGYKGSRL